MFHFEQHQRQGLLDLFVQGPEFRLRLQLWPQRRVHLQGYIGILGGVAGSCLDGDLVEADLLRALAGHILVLDGVDAQVELRHRIHVVAGGHAVEHIGLQHRIVLHAGKLDAVVAQHMRVVLQVVAELAPLRILEPGLEVCQAAINRKLVWCARIAMRQRQIRGLAGFYTEGHADDACHGVIEAGGLGVEGGELGLFEHGQPATERFIGEDGFVLAWRSGCVRRRWRRFDGSCVGGRCAGG